MAKSVATQKAQIKHKVERCVKSIKKREGRKNPTGSDYAICNSSIRGKKKK